MMIELSRARRLAPGALAAAAGRILVPALLLSILLVPALAAQESPSSSPVAPLAWMEGEWSGEGWFQPGPAAERLTFHQWERVTRVLGGQALLVEGIGRHPDLPDPIHEAVALLSLDPESGELRFRAYRTEGDEVLQVHAEAELDGEAMVWRMPVPDGGQMRYRIVRLPTGEWHERGDYSPDGAAWFPFLEMTLRPAG